MRITFTCFYLNLFLLCVPLFLLFGLEICVNFSAYLLRKLHRDIDLYIHRYNHLFSDLLLFPYNSKYNQKNIMRFSKLKLLSLNVRGLHNTRKRRAIFS